MESILDSVKKVLGIATDYTAFDEDILMHINAVLSILSQLGVGPELSVVVVNNTTQWTALGLVANQLSMAKSYIYLKVRMMFDPPGTSFHIGAIEEQIKELEVRMNTYREVILYESQSTP